jgi:Arc/MetJ-type ribon-helix-helix transcriptional regulator
VVYSFMAPKEKTVFSTDPRQILEVREAVQAGRYRTVSAFVREAIDEKLLRERNAALACEVERYVAAGHDHEEPALVTAQAWKARRPRAKR